MEDQLQSLDQVRASAIDMAFRFGPKLIVAIIILLLGYLAARWAGGFVRRLLRRFRLQPPVQILIERVVLCLTFGLFD